MYDTNILIENGVNLNKSLELFGDIATYNDNLDEFLDDVEDKLSKLEKYKQYADMANYAILVHSIKSDAKYFGFDKLAEMALEHEQESKNNNMYYIYDHYDELVKEINRITNLVKQYLGLDYEKVELLEENNIHPNNAILVVDDSNVISGFISKIFNNTYEVIIAKDGQEAIDKLSVMSGGIRAMLLDLNMPNVDGYEVLKFMKTNDFFKTINVAIISGTESSKIVETTRDYPIKAILEKPFNETNVKRVVEMVISR
ncbi:MAG: response regulator [Bacilli bacterium]|nr:response regulator [Bacilli bacterium]